MNKFINNKKGQAIFEMILFLPFLLFMYTIFYTAGNSINGSINQQKALRGYFYQVVKHNSYLINTSDLNAFSSMKQVGFFSLGWSEKMDGKTPVANCFKFSSLLKNGSSEECDTNVRDPADTSRFVRIFTMYGVCGPIYSAATNLTNGKIFIIDQQTQTYGVKIGDNAVAEQDLCALQ